MRVQASPSRTSSAGGVVPDREWHAGPVQCWDRRLRGLMASRLFVPGQRGYRPETVMPSAGVLLEIYLRDHHAAASAGVAIAHRVAARERPSSAGSPLGEVAAEIEADLRSLEGLMARLGVQPSRVKDTLARLAEKAGRLKLNGRLVRHSPLSDVFELETLVVGITGKQALWESLRGTGAIPQDQLHTLIERAQEQRQIVERCRRAATRRAFGIASATSTSPSS